MHKTSSHVHGVSYRHAKKPLNQRRRRPVIVLRRWLIVALMVEIAVAIFANPALQVTKVRIEGLQTLPAEQVFHEAHVPARTNLLLMLLKQHFATRLTKADSVIDKAWATVGSPHTLVLHVEERQPYAQLSNGVSTWLLDANSIPYRQLEAPQPEVPIVRVAGVLPTGSIVLGQPIHTYWLKNAYGLLDLLTQEKNLTAASIKVDQNANLCLNRTDKLQIKLGQADSLPQKIERAQEIVAADDGAIARRASYIDVSCPEQPVWMPKIDVQDGSGAHGIDSGLAPIGHRVERD